MSLGALTARPPAAAASASAGAAATNGAGAGIVGADNAFAALLAGLGEALDAASVPGEAAALAGTAPAGNTAQGDTPQGDATECAAALPAAAPDALAGMALLMAQYTPPGAAQAMPAALPAGAGAASAATPGLAAASPALSAQAAATAPAQRATDAALAPGATAGPVPATDLANQTSSSVPAMAGALAAQSLDAAPEGAPADAQAGLQAVPDMASLAAGWAAAPAPAPAPGAAAAPPLYQAAMASRPGDAAFTGDLAAQVTVLVEGGFQQAELRLNPPELGPIQIQLSVSAQTQTADISFSAVHGLTRESIERSLPELRDMLQSQGLSLGHTGVSGGQQQPGDGRDGTPAQARSARPGAQAGDAGAPLDGGPGAAPRAARASRGMLDLYA